MEKKGLKKGIQYVLFFGIGIILFVATLLTKSRGLSEENINIYLEAIELQEQMKQLGFSSFSLQDYKVAFYDGESDYVIGKDEGGFSIKKRKPVLDAFVCTAWETDGTYEVLCPVVEKFQNMVELLSASSMLEAAKEEGELSLEETYSKENHVATLWHEGFHCYQMTYFEKEVERLAKNMEKENLILEEVDQNPKVVDLYEKVLSLLEQAVKANNIDTVKDLVLQYKELEEERKSLLSKECQSVENYYTVLEGSARYVEYQAYEALLSSEEAKKEYVDTISAYGAGSEKYYKIGMAQCMILDKLEPEWGKGYDFSRSFLELIEEKLDLP